jgi:hypothetical protein
VANEQSKIMGMATTLDLASLPIRVASVRSRGPNREKMLLMI